LKGNLLESLGSSEGNKKKPFDSIGYISPIDVDSMGSAKCHKINLLNAMIKAIALASSGIFDFIFLVLSSSLFLPPSHFVVVVVVVA
jgi:hypothetical protein